MVFTSFGIQEMGVSIIALPCTFFRSTQSI